MLSKITGLLALTFAFSACTYTPLPENENYIIGQKLKDLTSLTAETDSALSKIVLYDKTVDMIHQFDLSKQIVERSLKPKFPGGEHAVLYHQNGNYVIDLYQKYIGIYNKKGELTSPNLGFVGTPKTAAFRPSLGYLVIYDDMSSVIMLKLDANGNIVMAWPAGPVLSSCTGTANSSIASGDIDESGRLILGMSDDTIALVDLDQSMTQEKWVCTSFASTLTDLRWIAPVNGAPNQILIRSADKLSLMDVATQSILDSKSLSTSDYSIKTSKAFDPHVLTMSYNHVTAYFAQNSKIESRTVKYEYQNILSSRLSLANDSWTLVDSNRARWYDFDQPNQFKTDRMLKRYRVSDLYAQEKMALPNEATLEITQTHIFELFPSAYGYAVYQNLDDDSKVVFSKFNKEFLHK